MKALSLFSGNRDQIKRPRRIEESGGGLRIHTLYGPRAIWWRSKAQVALKSRLFHESTKRRRYYSLVLCMRGLNGRRWSIATRSHMRLLIDLRHSTQQPIPHHQRYIAIHYIHRHRHHRGQDQQAESCHSLIRPHRVHSRRSWVEENQFVFGASLQVWSILFILCAGIPLSPHSFLET